MNDAVAPALPIRHDTVAILNVPWQTAAPRQETFQMRDAAIVNVKARYDRFTDRGGWRRVPLCRAGRAARRFSSPLRFGLKEPVMDGMIAGDPLPFTGATCPIDATRYLKADVARRRPRC